MIFDERKDPPAENLTARSSSPEETTSGSGKKEGRDARLPWPSALIRVLATGFGLGYSPVAPGTMGAALGVGIYCAVLLLGAVDIILPLVSLGLFLAGVHLSSAAECIFRQKDSPRIVIDEIASFPCTMLFIPPSPVRVAIAFALNRAADTLKPFPAGRIQRLKGGWGVMLDDLVAAIYANLALRLLMWVLNV